MNYFTAITNEMKRESVNFAKKMSKGLSKPNQKFIGDMIYGISASKDIKISKIARQLHESIKLDNTIERLCLHLESFEEKEKINENYYKYIRTMIPEYPIGIFDDSDITKVYGKKFEDLDWVRDASDPKESYKPGYHMCNAVVLTKDMKQPAPVYNKIYSSKSKDFKSTNTETYKSIDAFRECVKRKSFMVFDRGYDDQKLFDYVITGGDDLLVRLKENRTFLFKGKKKKIEESYNKHKGKIKMKLIFEGEEKETYLSYTRATLPKDNREYTLLYVYGLSEKEKFILLTNKKIKGSKEAIKLVRTYMDRWRIETYHRSIKAEYHYEDMRVRSLKSINHLTYLFNLVIGYIIGLAEDMNQKLLSIKIIEESKSLRQKVGVWITQFARGIHIILSRAMVGIKEYFKETKKKIDHEIFIIQLSLQI